MNGTTLDLTVAHAAASRAPGFLRRIKRAVRNFPDRLLHPRRLESVLRRLSRMRRPGAILVVCHGNICRSPYLEAVLRRELPDIAVSSAGFIGSDRRVPAVSLEVSARRGLDLANFRSRLVSFEMVRNADLVIVMEPEQARHILGRFRISRARVVIAGDLDPEPSSTRAIADPWMQPAEVFESSFDRLDRCARSLVAVLAEDG